MMSTKSASKDGPDVPSSALGTRQSHESLSNELSGDEEQPTPELCLKSAHHKLDRRLVLWYSFVYLIMRIHVSNISNTAIINLEQGTGIQTQLGNLSSQQWAWVLSIFYYPYMFLEPLATLCLKKFGPRKWMVRIMVTWVCVMPTPSLFAPVWAGCANITRQGIISMCQGACTNYSGILACRFFLGAAEAGFYPGVL